MPRKILIALVSALVFVAHAHAADSNPKPAPGPVAVHPEADLDHLVKGELDAVIAGFDATMTSALPKSQLATVWTALGSQAGTYKSHGKAEMSEQGGYRVALIPMAFEKGDLLAKLVYDSDGKIAGLFFLPAPSKPAFQHSGIRSLEFT